jgi:hypothetical protein
MRSNIKYFVSTDMFLLGDFLASGQIHCPLADLFIRGSSCILIEVCSLKQNFFLTNNENNNLETRQRNNLYLPQAKLNI